jgi:hypothetical protein
MKLMVLVFADFFGGVLLGVVYASLTGPLRWVDFRRLDFASRNGGNAEGDG